MTNKIDICISRTLCSGNVTVSFDLVTFNHGGVSSLFTRGTATVVVTDGVIAKVDYVAAGSGTNLSAIYAFNLDGFVALGFLDDDNISLACLRAYDTENQNFDLLTLLGQAKKTELQGTTHLSGTVNLGSEEVKTLVGNPTLFYGEVIPIGYLEFAGQAFDPLAYPELAKLYPSGVMPDLRGYFLRGYNGEGELGDLIPDSVAGLGFNGTVLPPHTHSIGVSTSEKGDTSRMEGRSTDAGSSSLPLESASAGTPEGVIKEASEETAPAHTLVKIIAIAG